MHMRHVHCGAGRPEAIKVRAKLLFLGPSHQPRGADGQITKNLSSPVVRIIRIAGEREIKP